MFRLCEVNTQTSKNFPLGSRYPSRSLRLPRGFLDLPPRFSAHCAARGTARSEARRTKERANYRNGRTRPRTAFPSSEASDGRPHESGNFRACRFLTIYRYSIPLGRPSRNARSLSPRRDSRRYPRLASLAITINRHPPSICSIYLPEKTYFRFDTAATITTVTRTSARSVTNAARYRVVERSHERSTIVRNDSRRGVARARR